MTTDPFFETIHDGQWNACVGDQGNALNYVDGYLEAARELIAAVIDKRLFGSRDTLAMPILYNCRHGLELALKFFIDRLHRIEMIGSHPINHDIQSHWQHLRDGHLGDRKLRQLIEELRPFVASLASIDEDGQELRYALNRNGDRSLDGIGVVNLPLIRRSIDDMSAILESIKNRIFDLEEDRPTGAHTTECSRADLLAIASMIGNHDTWREPSFDDRKREAMELFGLSSRKFSAAVTAIRKSRALAAAVGIESELRYLSDEKAVAALKLWADAHPLKAHDSKDPGIDYFNRDREKFLEALRIARELDDAIIQLLSPEEFADLHVVFYIGRDRLKGEHYDEEIEQTLRVHRVATSRLECVHHIMSKTNLLSAVADGVEAIGRPRLADELRRIRTS